MLFKRKLRLNIEINGILKEYEHTSENTSLKINFNIKKARGTEENATFSIVGLSLTDIQELSTKFDYSNGKVKPNRIFLEAGYQNDFSKIFDGAIVDCEPKLDGADFILDIKAQAGFYNSTIKREPVSISNAKLSDIARNIAENY